MLSPLSKLQENRKTGLFPLQALPQPQHYHGADPPIQHEVHAVQSKGQLLSCPFQARKGKRNSSPAHGAWEVNAGSDDVFVPRSPVLFCVLQLPQAVGIYLR